jgi:hypothetical protein
MTKFHAKFHLVKVDSAPWRQSESSNINPHKQPGHYNLANAIEG